METRFLVTGGSGFIGTFLIQSLVESGISNILNIDIAEPKEKEHLKFWTEADILEKEKIISLAKKFQPENIIHLAARTDTNPKNVLEDYKVNTEGTQNVLETVQNCASAKRLIITSTQFVHQYNGFPKHDEDYAPHTIYGESKVITEQLTRSADLNCIWTIIRPTNIWGPRHPRYPQEFWYVLKVGKYIHPGKKQVIRSYGYVGNVVDQIMTLLKTDPIKVHQEVFYVGDKPISLYDWVNGFSIALRKRNVKVVPRFIVKAAAVGGNILNVFGINFPITLSRYKSMTQDNIAPMDKTFEILGSPKYSLQQGINETTDWLKQQNEFWSK